jgi:RNA polymerase sigma factor for flagellar operon FliA
MNAALAPPLPARDDARPADEEEAALWQRLRADNDAGARECLVRLHLPYARTIAAMLYGRRFHDEVEFGDYLQLASVGLLEAVDRFDPGRGAQVRTFASRRIQGAILNGLEKLTEKQQQIAVRQRLAAARVAEVRDLAEERLGLRGTPAGTDQLFQFVSEVGIGLALAWMLEGTGMIDAPERAEHQPFYRTAEIRQLRARLLQVVDALPEQERIVVSYHYLQDIPFESVATMLQLTRGRISQIHKQALLRLRAALGQHGSLDIRF